MSKNIVAFVTFLIVIGAYYFLEIRMSALEMVIFYLVILINLKLDEKEESC